MSIFKERTVKLRKTLDKLNVLHVLGVKQRCPVCGERGLYEPEPFYFDLNGEVCWVNDYGCPTCGYEWKSFEDLEGSEKSDGQNMEQTVDGNENNS